MAVSKLARKHSSVLAIAISPVRTIPPFVHLRRPRPIAAAIGPSATKRNSGTKAAFGLSATLSDTTRKAALSSEADIQAARTGTASSSKGLMFPRLGGNLDRHEPVPRFALVAARSHLGSGAK